MRGRRTESAVLDGMIAAVREGESRTLVVRGEAGVGKTALLEYVVEAASDLRVVRAAGVESEMELAFAAPAPAVRADARSPGAPSGSAARGARIVFGLSAGAAPDRFLVGLAVLSLLSEVAERASAAVRRRRCAVAGSRVGADARRSWRGGCWRSRSRLVFAAREPDEELRGLPELEVQGLRNGDAHALLRLGRPVCAG